MFNPCPYVCNLHYKLYCNYKRNIGIIKLPVVQEQKRLITLLLHASMIITCGGLDFVH